MAESILSSSELEALRQAVDAGAMNTAGGGSSGVVEYGEDLPRLRLGEVRIGGTQREERLAYAFDRAARTLEPRLADIVRASVRVDVTHLATGRYAEFREMFEVDARELALLGYTVAGISGSGLVCVEPSVVERMVESLMGGMPIQDAMTEEVEPIVRPLTALDLRVTRRWVERFLADLSYAWNPAEPLPATLTAAGTSGIAVRSFRAKTQVVMALLEITCGDELCGQIGVLVPHAAIDQLANPGSRPAPDAKQEDMRHGVLSPELPGFPVELDVVLGTQTLSVRDVLALGVGDTLWIDRPGAAIASVQGVPKLIGNPGTLGGRRALCVIDHYTGDRDA